MRPLPPLLIRHCTTEASCHACWACHLRTSSQACSDTSSVCAQHVTPAPGIRYRRSWSSAGLRNRCSGCLHCACSPLRDSPSPPAPHHLERPCHHHGRTPSAFRVPAIPAARQPSAVAAYCQHRTFTAHAMLRCDTGIDEVVDCGYTRSMVDGSRFLEGAQVV